MTETGRPIVRSPDGPAVILGNAQSLFVRQLAETWRGGGRDVVIVTETQNIPDTAPEGVRIVNSHDYRHRSLRFLRVINPALRFAERTMPRLMIRRYQKRTGRQVIEPWEWYWVDHFWDSWCRARAAMSCRPAFVFGQESSSYGLATSLCKGVPRILFPWGGDIFNHVESSPVVNWMTTRALRNVDLIVPSSMTAARYIPDRFGVDKSKIEAVSWGVDLKLFRRASAERRDAILNHYGIPVGFRVIVNARRFKTLWGAMDALEACMKVAGDHGDVHCIFLGGSGTQVAIEAANARVVEAGLQRRFTFLTENIPLSDYADILSVVDIFLSLLGRGDMRSSSVLQGAACGGTPVIVDSPEYRMMTKQGFAAEFVPEGNVPALTTTIERILSSEKERLRIRTANQSYISTHEDQDRQMTHLLQLIDEVRARYRR